MDEVGSGGLGELLLDILRHGDGSRVGGKILLFDLQNPVYVFSQPVGSLRLQKTEC